MDINYNGSQGQTERAVVLQEEEEEEDEESVFILTNRKRKYEYIMWAKCIAHVAESAATHSYHCDVRSHRLIPCLWLTVFGEMSQEWRNASIITDYNPQQVLEPSQKKKKKKTNLT